MELSLPRSGLSPFVQALIAGSLLVVVLSLGIFIGKNSGETMIHVAMPAGFEIKGLPQGIVHCLNWVTENFKQPTAGTYALVCHGRLP